MNRLEWLKERRIMVEKRYDTIFSIDYDDRWGRIEEKHKKNLLYFLDLIPDGSIVLDAACGTGKYWSIITEKGSDIIGIDQSQKMLDQAKYKYPDVYNEKIGLQEINCINKFAGIICIDAMENIFPEEWVLVLKNFYSALKEKGVLYFTVEIIKIEEKENAYEKGVKMGLPIIEGEYADEGEYHYYPSIEMVKAWLTKIGFSIIKENKSDGYCHFIVIKR